jgi:hypothetical protein
MMASASRSHSLALDLASTSGWCGGVLGTRPRHGSVSLRGERPIERCAALRQWLDDYEAVAGKVTHLVLEAAIVGQHNALATVELLWGLRTTALMWAYDGEIAPHMVQSFASSTVRAHMLGTSRFPKGEAKNAVMEWCRRKGFDTASHDAADAILTWHYAEAIATGKPRVAPGIFAGSPA